MSVDTFTSWCSKSKSNFISVEPVRKVVKMEKDSQKVRFRELNVLDDKYHGKMKSNIGNKRNKGIILINYLS
jgi:hypothetical protein